MFWLVMGVSLLAVILSFVSVFVEDSLTSSFLTITIASVVPVYVFLMVRKLKPELRVESNPVASQNGAGE